MHAKNGGVLFQNYCWMLGCVWKESIFLFATDDKLINLSRIGITFGMFLYEIMHFMRSVQPTRAMPSPPVDGHCSMCLCQWCIELVISMILETYLCFVMHCVLRTHDIYICDGLSTFVTDYLFLWRSICACDEYLCLWWIKIEKIHNLPLLYNNIWYLYV